jgi:hypothetical protein
MGGTLKIELAEESSSVSTQRHQVCDVADIEMLGPGLSLTIVFGILRGFLDAMRHWWVLGGTASIAESQRHRCGILHFPVIMSYAANVVHVFSRSYILI